jgi:hypothetical protein
LSSADERLCAGSGAALSRLLQRLGVQQARTMQIVAVLADQYVKCAPEGQRQVLLLVLELWRQAGDAAPAELQASAGQIVKAAAGARDNRRLPALQLAHRLMQCADSEPYWPACRFLAREALKAPREEERILAVKLAAYSALDLFDQLPPLLAEASGDPSSEVRTLALLTLGSRDQLLPTESLLGYLHDRDRDLRLVAEQILRTRGLTATQLRLAKMLTHPDPGVRARVPDQILEVPEVDSTIWLERLSRDTSPSVRAAVLRIAFQSEAPQLRAWLRRVSEQDPSPTVQSIARYYQQVAGARD